MRSYEISFIFESIFMFILMGCLVFVVGVSINLLLHSDDIDGGNITNEHIEENINYMTGIGLNVTRYNSKESIYFKIDSDSYSIVVDSPEKLELFVHGLKIGRNQDTNSQTGKVFVLENLSEKDNTLFKLEVE